MIKDVYGARDGLGITYLIHLSLFKDVKDNYRRVKKGLEEGHRLGDTLQELPKDAHTAHFHVL